MALIARGILHGLVVIAVFGFSILGPGFVGSVVEEAERLVRGSRSAALAPDFKLAIYALYGVHLLCLVGAWQVSTWTNRWRLGRAPR